MKLTELSKPLPAYQLIAKWGEKKVAILAEFFEERMGVKCEDGFVEFQFSSKLIGEEEVRKVEEFLSS